MFINWRTQLFKIEQDVTWFAVLSNKKLFVLSEYVNHPNPPLFMKVRKNLAIRLDTGDNVTFLGNRNVHQIIFGE